MSTNDILRRYLDILNEDEVPTTSTDTPATNAPTGEVPTIAPVQGKGSIKEVIEAVKSFQSSIGKEPTGNIDPPTLAAILSQSGALGKDDMAKLKAGHDQQQSAETDPVTEGVDGQGSSKHDQLTDKSALHLGYAHGLQGHEHQCPHGVGTSAHSHYSHGFNEGLKECGMGKIWTNPTF